ncbi:uncharacterized protein LOC132557455 [Ylistrum balloti]|nr:uncharacterized protein LOC132551220 [Ylistrum balloti]XP_060076969.1 uncharacterized protein LOC132556573 [Ylistrum balloti]XP_060077925.1 uncharacterized protein LOC132557455 [Ylistrum balloti]
MLHLSRKQNSLWERIEREGLFNRPSKWQKMETTTDIIFPVLTEEDLRNLTLGVYQLKLARSYTQEHMSETGGYEVSICKVDANLINAKIQSRHFSSKLYQLWVSFDDCNVQGWYCTCRAGARVVGTCSHVASILWYMGFARHLDKSFDFSKDWTQYLQDASYTPDPISIDESDDEGNTEE